MKIHEYQAKAILARYGVTIPRSEVAFSKEEARAAQQTINNDRKIDRPGELHYRRNGVSELLAIFSRVSLVRIGEVFMRCGIVTLGLLRGGDL